ncbi:MAG: methionyl-tRNA formyltransferase [Flavobacteriales bacterium]|nr:methionyl-tRNA formyltransferase [Flavobacteriales bacterium]
MKSASMRIVFMGTPGFAVESLEIINKSHHEVVGVITATDKPAGRGQKVQYSDVKRYALDNDLNILQPENLKDENFLNSLRDLHADLFVVVAFRMLPEVVWKMPSKGTINLHASLLPQYRGAAPINWAIINGEKETGATTFFIEEKIDTGNVIDQFKVDISEDMTAGELHDLLMIEGSKLLLNTIDKIESGKASAQSQKEMSNTELKKAFKIFKETCKIDWNKEGEAIHNLIRGLSPYPAAYSDLSIQGKETTAKIFRSKLRNTNELQAGKVETDYKTYLIVGTGTQDLNILELQLAGKKRMNVADFLNGYKDHEICFN